MRISYTVVGLALSAAAYGLPAMAQSNAQYQAERAACDNGTSHQDRATCLQEAGAAKGEAAKGKLTGAASGDANTANRCSNLPAGQRGECEARMQRGGGTSTSGSVEGGGIIREHRSTQVGTPPAR